MNRPDATFARPHRPLELDPEPDPTSMVLLDGTIKQCLEIGRTRLLAAGLIFAMAFLVVGLRLVDVSLLTDGNEPRLAATPRSTALETVRADIVDRNGVVLATTLPTASLYANPRQILDPEAVAGRLSAASMALARDPCLIRACSLAGTRFSHSAVMKVSSLLRVPATSPGSGPCPIFRQGPEQNPGESPDEHSRNGMQVAPWLMQLPRAVNGWRMATNPGMCIFSGSMRLWALVRILRRSVFSVIGVPFYR